MIELLAPAKNKICAKAAVDYGADAIYIGAYEFGARKNASNSLEDIKEITEYAHKFNVKVYVTVNTILTNEEIIKAKELVKNLYKIGVDAFIIQDLGLFDVIKADENLKNIELHASTQCDNSALEKVQFLENIGFSRIVLAREFSLEQIAAIKKKTNVELEVFIHGALCVSYSGQCYLSQMIGGRSANRGECAQPCRKKYSLIDEDGNFIAKNKYLLCLKDFNASNHIKKLADIGVTSLKIEGRLKDENYVKNVVAYYRKLIDNLGIGKTSSGEVILDFEPNLKKSFNRGFTDYFLEKRKDCFNFDSPKSKGEYIGKVSKVGKDFFEIEKINQTITLNPQDGLCFISKEDISGCLINKIENSRIYPNKIDTIKAGIEIYRNFDYEFEKKLKNSKTCRKIQANITFNIGKVIAIDADNNSAEISYEFEEIAQNEEKARLNITTQLKKSGESDFFIENVQINSDKIPFLPVSKLNELRRDLLEKLMQERVKNYKNKRNLSPIKNKIDAIYPQNEIDYKANILNDYAKEFYEKHGCKVEEWALEKNKTKNYSEKCTMTTKHCLKYAFNICKSPKKLFLVDEKGKRYNLNFDCKKCEMQILF